MHPDKATRKPGFETKEEEDRKTALSSSPALQHQRYHEIVPAACVRSNLPQNNKKEIVSKHMFLLDPITRSVSIAVDPEMVGFCRQLLQTGRILLHDMQYHTETEGTTELALLLSNSHIDANVAASMAQRDAPCSAPW